MFCENEGSAQGSGCSASDIQLNCKERTQSWLYSLSLHHTCKDTEKAFQTSGSIVTTVNPAWILICYLQIGYGMDAGSTISPLLHCVFNTSLPRKTKYLLYFALPNWRDRGSKQLWFYLIERWGFLPIFFFLREEKKYFLWASLWSALWNVFFSLYSDIPWLSSWVLLHPCHWNILLLLHNFSTGSKYKMRRITDAFIICWQFLEVFLGL